MKTCETCKWLAYRMSLMGGFCNNRDSESRGCVCDSGDYCIHHEDKEGGEK